MRNSVKNFFSIDLSNRVFGLDILRFFSIFFVIYAHALPFIENIVDKHRYMSIIPVNDAVSIFFVLSGFLIGKILLKVFIENEISTKLILNFWIRRWFRTLPAYYFTVLILIVLSYLYFGSLRDFNWKYLFFLQNFKTPISGFFIESWSLTIEEWFYLSFPVCLFLVTKIPNLSKKTLFLLVISLFILFPILYRIRRGLLLDSLNPADLPLFTQQVITRIDTIVYGVLGAFIKYFYPVFWHKIRFKSLIVLLILHTALRYLSFHPFGFFSQTISTSYESLEILLVFPFFDAIKKGSGLLHKIITTVSIISYSLYLLNLSVVYSIIMPALNEGIQGLVNYPLLNYGLYFLINIFFAYLLYTFCEKPMMQLRERYSKHDN